VEKAAKTRRMKREATDTTKAGAGDDTMMTWWKYGDFTCFNMI
jgi:hypothetical protein